MIMLQVVRQDEPLLITTINQLSRGFLSNTSLTFIRSLDGYLSVPAKEKRVLFSTNDAVDIHNTLSLQNSQGRRYVYESKDDGSKALLKKMAAKEVANTLSLILC